MCVCLFVHAGTPGEGRPSFGTVSEERASFATDETQPVDIMGVPDPPEPPLGDVAREDQSAEDRRRAYQCVPGTPTRSMLGKETREECTPSSQVCVRHFFLFVQLRVSIYIYIYMRIA